jgi:hypothetical protein
VDFPAMGRVSFDRRYWQTSHYALFITEQVEGDILDKENHYGLGWFPIDSLPPLFWSDERELIERNREVIAALALNVQ